MTASNLRTEVESAYRAYHRELMRQWRERNRERDRANSRKWRKRHKAMSLDSGKMWRRMNKDKVRAANKAWCAKNPNYHRDRYYRLKAEGAFAPGGKYYEVKRAKGKKPCAP